MDNQEKWTMEQMEQSVKWLKDNAQLIDAAPLLLEACEEVLYDGMNNLTESAISKLESAIKKAKAPDKDKERESDT